MILNSKSCVTVIKLSTCDHSYEQSSEKVEVINNFAALM